jgi:hypothetical protein
MAQLVQRSPTVYGCSLWIVIEVLNDFCFEILINRKAAWINDLRFINTENPVADISLALRNLFI